MPSEDKFQTILEDRTIYIVGPRRLQNRLLSQFVSRETGAVCIEDANLERIFGSKPEEEFQMSLFLWDALGGNLETILNELKQQHASVLNCYFVPFNVDPSNGHEAQALGYGVRGFFYEEDSPDQILKGIRAIFSNELWVSREILTKCILEQRGRGENPQMEPMEPNLLTTRETEILTQIAAGATNEEIADRLCISPHTVRTHIYNIFKKINVPNRLQAALWATQNL
ncbi:MAG: DNA-binding response regulator [Desulfobacteraceae bacterium]|nr:MAG: DNA-binding response regulator [Desulfobacteraceae bacterium]